MSTIDLSTLPEPSVVETLSFENIVREMRAIAARFSPQAFSEMRESDPGLKLIEVFAMREMLLRGRINDAVKGLLLGTADETTLPWLGAWVGVERKVLDPGDPANGIPPTLEPLDDFRDRIQKASATWSVAGPRKAYIQLALAASTDVVSANAVSDPANPGTVIVPIVGPDYGVADQALIDTVRVYLSAEDKRPLTDQVSVISATIETINVSATIYLTSTTGQQGVIDAVAASMDALIESSRAIGSRVSRSQVYAALMVPGVDYSTVGGDFAADEILPADPAVAATGSPLLVPVISAEANGQSLGVVYP